MRRNETKGRGCAIETTSVLTARNVAIYQCSEVVVHEEAHVEEYLMAFPDAAGKGVQRAADLVQAVPSHRLCRRVLRFLAP